MTARVWVLFVLASMAGALARYATANVLDRRGLATRATVVVNVVGCMTLGVVAGYATHRGLDRDVVLVVGTAFCGSLTTFSTFAAESLDVTDRAGPIPGAAYVVVSVAGPLAAAGLALACSAALWG